MRFVVLLFGFVGVLMTGFMGVMMIFASEFVAFLEGLNDPNVNTALEFFIAHPGSLGYEETGAFLLLASLYGLLGTVLAFARCGWQGALMMLLPVLFTGLANPFSLAFSCVQAFAAMLSFFVFPLPLDQPSDSEDDSDEDEEEEEKPKPKPKAKPKRRMDDDDE